MLFRSEWLGFRPTLPDFLPVMGPSKKYRNVFYCFGHHHLGWTLGPISGKIVSGMIARENTNLNLDVFDVASNNVETWVDVMQVRSGKIKTRDHFQMEVQDFHDNKLILSSFIKSYYLKNNYPPKEILVSNLPSDKTDIEEFLKNKKVFY